MAAYSNMPIAIIGIGCRFPGSSDSPERLWKLCVEAKSAWSEWPKDRLNEKAFYHPQTEHLGTFHAKGAHFLDEDPSLCDASFFNFSADMARAMDPQVRILLETAFEAFESAGLTMEDVAGSQTSSFGGALFHDYNDVLMMDVENLPRYAATGNGPTMIANRISHFFDLRGPSISVDTACSTAMASLHLACQSLRSGDAEMAVVGGTNLILHPGSSIGLSTLGFLSASGISYSFDSRAGGYGRGEGVGCIVVKPLATALRDGNPIRAIVRGTAMNQDGHTPTISSPSQEAQEQLIRICYERAGLDPKDTPYVEAHGTGTITGDKTETTAIGNVFGPGRPEGERLIVGSIKSNIGHAESASGISAIAKVIMMFENGCIPPQALFNKPNPQIDFDALRIKIPREAMSWPEHLPRRASIGNFGVGGSNTHAILEDPKYYFSARANEHAMSNGYSLSGVYSATNGYPRHESHLAASSTGGSAHHLIYTISAKEERSAKAYMNRLQEYLRGQSAQEHLRDIAYTLTQRRSHFPWRVAIAANSVSSLQDALASAVVIPVRASKVPRLGFVFTGQGAQWHAMGRELMLTYPTFLSVLQAADKHLVSLGSSWSVIEELFKSKESTRLHHPFLSFPVTVILQLALIQLLTSWGITATAATGHSSGEIAAAYTAGIVTFEEAIAIAYLRGRITSDFVDTGRLRGGMTSLGVGKEEASEYLRELGPKAVIACVNSQSNVTISGDVDALEQVEAQAQSNGVFFRRLKIPAAYHAPHMQPLAEEYGTALRAHLREERHPSKPKIPFSSPVTGSGVSEINGLRDPAHWVRNMTQPVLFEDAFVSMVLDGQTGGGKRNTTVDAIVEIGPHDALRGIIRQILQQPNLANLDITVDACLKRGTDAVGSMQDLVGRLYCQGYPINFKAINFPGGNHSLNVVYDLPKYQWNHSTQYWAESSVCAETLRREHAHHDLLGLRVVGLNTKQAIWRNTLRMTDLPWLQHHAVQSEVLFPGVGLAVVAIEAMKQQLSSKAGGMPGGYLLSDLDMFKALVIPTNDQGIEMQVVLGDADQQTRGETCKSFTFYSRGRNGDWLEHCNGTIVGATSRPASITNISNVADHLSVDVKHFYKCFPKIGPTLGSSFQNVTSLLCDNGSAIGIVTIPDTIAMMPYPYQSECWVHPTVLDSCFQVAWAAMPEVILEQMGVCIITYAKTLYLGSAAQLPVGSKLEVHARITKMDHQGFDFSLSVFEAQKEVRLPIFQADGVRVQSLSPRTVNSDFDNTMILHPVWQPDVTMMSEKDLGAAIKIDQTLEEASYHDLQTAVVSLIHDVLEDLSSEEMQGMSQLQRNVISWMQQVDHQSHITRQDKEEKLELYERLTPSSANGALLSVASNKFIKILRNEVSFEPMARHELLRDFYENSIGFNTIKEGVQEFARLFAHKSPQLRVLEIGAGFGATTGAVLEGLRQGNSASLTGIRYEFTDKLKDFLDSARIRFQSSIKHMRFQTLDIEHDPLAQGFEAETYDLVVASNVLHVTANIEQGIQHARKLLKSGGTLLLVETTKASPDQCLALSLGPDWWPNNYSERAWPPLLSNEEWTSTLTANHFDVELNYSHDLGSKDTSRYSIIAAKNLDSSYEQTSSRPSQATVVHLPGSVVAPRQWIESLAEEIRNRTGIILSVENLGSPSLSGKPCIIFAEGNQDFLSHVQPEEFEALKATMQEASHILWVSRGGAHEMTTPESSLASGLLRTLRLEERVKAFVSLDLDPAEKPWKESAIQTISKIFQRSVGSYHQEDRDYEFAQRSGRILVPRMMGDAMLNQQLSAARGHLVPKDATFSSEGIYRSLEPAVPGLLNSLVFKECDKSLEEDTVWTEDMVEIAPQAFGLGLQDVLAAAGEVDKENKGFECAGHISRVGSNVPQHLRVGDRVCTIIPTGNFANRVCAPWTSVASVPSDMSLEKAASIPIDFAVSFYCLDNLARLESGDRVLVHGAASGLGQAAIRTAQYLGADVFVTVASESERDFLTDEFSILRDHILLHLDASFNSAILEATGGYGLDVVLDCNLSGRTPRMSTECVAPFGHLIHLGVGGDNDAGRPDRESSNRSITYSSVDIGKLGRVKSKVLSRNLGRIIGLIQQKMLVNEIEITKFSVSDCDKAFSLLQGGSFLGKIVVTAHEGDPIKVLSPYKSVTLDASAAYLVVGGLGGLGLEIARWMARRGARNLILMSRNATQYDTEAFRKGFKEFGAEIFVRNCDISDQESLVTAMGEYRRRWTIRGVIQAATVLQDSLFSKMTSEQWNTSMQAKYKGTRNLDALFCGPEVDFFIILSSLTAVVGNMGQANYTAAGAYQDALVYNRVARGLPAVSINIGSVPDLGSALRTGMADQIDRMGCRYQKRSELVQLVELAIKHPRQQQMITGIKLWAEPENLRWRQEPRFAFTRLPNTQEDSSKRQKGAKASSVKDRLVGLSEEAAGGILVEVLREQLAGMTAFSTSDIDPDEQLLTYGVDSLVAVEFRALLQANVTLGVTIFDIIQSISLRDLAIKVWERISEE